jgi:hypothetical protein
MNTFYVQIEPEMLIDNVLERYQKEARLGGFDEIAFYWFDRNDPYKKVKVEEEPKNDTSKA